MRLNEQDIKSHLQQISDILLINGGFLCNPGLYSGEMGLVLFFSHYSRYTQNDLYLDYSYGLMEKIQNRMHRKTPIDYEKGLAGIGSAVEYLVQNNFFETDTDEILEDFDKRLFLSYQIEHLPIEDILDIGRYTLWKLSGNTQQKDTIIHNILPQIINVMEEWYSSQELTYSFIDLYAQFLKTGFKSPSINNCIHHFYQSLSVNNILPHEILCWSNSLLQLTSYPEFGIYKGKVEAIIENIMAKKFPTSLPHPNIFIGLQMCKTKTTDNMISKYYNKINIKNIINYDMGFQTGLAGWGIFLLSELDQDNSWASLLSSDFYTFKK